MFFFFVFVSSNTICKCIAVVVNANKGDSFKRRRAPTQDTDDAEHDDALSGHKRPISAAEQQRQTARHNRQAIERVTELADRLIGRGMNDIYTTSYEALQANTTRWEYQGADGSLYGPFTTKQILDWRQQGFLTGETAVMIRPVKHRVVLPLPASSSGATGVDSDDGCDRQRKRSRPNDVSASSSTAANAAAAANPTDDSSGTNDWQHSDSVDFRSIYRLDQEIGAHEESAPTREAHSTRPSGGSSGDQRRMAASANPSSHRSVRFERAAALYSDDEANGDNNDDDDDDDEAEGFQRRRRSNQRRTFDEEDEDD